MKTEKGSGRGGARPGAGRPKGSRSTDNEKFGSTISAKNLKWLRAQKGEAISDLLNAAVAMLRKTRK